MAMTAADGPARLHRILRHLAPQSRAASLLARSASSAGGGDSRQPFATIESSGFIVDSSELAGPQRSHMFVALCPSRSGAIYATFRRGVDKSQEDGNSVIAVSHDQGRSWETIFTNFPHVYTPVTGEWAADDARRGTWTYGMDGRTGDGRQGGTAGEIRGAMLAELPDGSLLAVWCWKDSGAAVVQEDGRTDTPSDHPNGPQKAVF